MSRVVDRLLVFVYVALAALPAIGLAMGWKGRPVFGALPPAELPEITFTDVVGETTQKGIASWFESNLGFKGTSIALDNALLYFGFGETKPFASVVVGTDRTLFLNEDVGFYNKSGPWITDPAYVNLLADHIASAQERLRERHIALVPVIIPAKTSIWRDHLPDKWVMDLPYPRPSEETTRMVAQALLLRGVTFVDARALLRGSDLPRTDLWGPDARHWSLYASCLAMDKIVDAFAALRGEPRLPFGCRLAHRSAHRSDADLDLWGLLNAYGVPHAKRQTPFAQFDAPPPSTGPRPRVLIVGTSFSWQLFENTNTSGVFGEAYVAYYNTTFHTQGVPDAIPVKPGTPEWRGIVMGSQLVVLDLFESYLANPGTYVDGFVDDVLRELDAR